MSHPMQHLRRLWQRDASHPLSISLSHDMQARRPYGSSSPASSFHSEETEAQRKAQPQQGMAWAGWAPGPRSGSLRWPFRHPAPISQPQGACWEVKSWFGSKTIDPGSSGGDSEISQARAPLALPQPLLVAMPQTGPLGSHLSPQCSSKLAWWPLALTQETGPWVYRFIPLLSTCVASSKLFNLFVLSFVICKMGH